MKEIKKKILITRKAPEHVLNYLSEKFDVEMWDSETDPITSEKLENEIPSIDGLLCLLTDDVNADLIKKSTTLKVISNLAVGYNNIDVAEATKENILVTNTPGVLTETTADLTFALLLATARRLMEASDVLRNGNWKSWSPMFLTGMDVHGATLGIVGLGEIGEAVVRRAKGFGMKILYHNRSPRADMDDTEYVSLEKLLTDSDYVCILTPYNNQTKNMITSNELNLMKKTAILINTSRGGIVNEDDLVQALKSGEIWGAGLDVFEEEPVPLSHPLLSLPNVVTLPHIGSASIGTRIRMWELAAENLVRVLEGNEPTNVVNKR